MKDNNNKIKTSIKNLQNSIVQRAIIKSESILNDAVNYIDLIYKYSFNNSKVEEVEEWFKIKDVILLSNLHYIKNQIDNNETENIDYSKILDILNDYQKYMIKNSTGYDIPYFDFENEIKIKRQFLSKKEIKVDENDHEYIYYYSCYSPNGKILKLKRNYNYITNSSLSIFAVIHNIFIRTKTISQTDYLLQKNYLSKN